MPPGMKKFIPSCTCNFSIQFLVGTTLLPHPLTPLERLDVDLTPGYNLEKDNVRPTFEKKTTPTNKIPFSH